MTELEFREAVVALLKHVMRNEHPLQREALARLADLEYEVHMQRLRHEAGDD